MKFTIINVTLFTVENFVDVFIEHYRTDVGFDFRVHCICLLQSLSRLNDSKKYVEQYATVLLDRDELGKKWARYMRETCFGCVSHVQPPPIAAALSTSTLSSSNSSLASRTSDTSANSESTLVAPALDSHVALDAILPWCCFHSFF